MHIRERYFAESMHQKKANVELCAELCKIWFVFFVP